jgi:hypothetical protein
MRAIWTWVRSDLRREWRATVALILLVGLGGSVVLTTLAGARRTSSAFDRLREHTDAADVRVQYSTDDPVDDAVLAALRSHPDVELAVPIYITIGSSEASPFDLGVFASPEPGLLHDVDRMLLLEGRNAHPNNPHEVTTNPVVAESLGVGIGDTFAMATFTPEQVDAFDFAEMGGPVIELTVVGIGRLPDDVADEDFVGIFGTPAFHERYGSETGGYGPTVEVLVRDGADPVRTAEDALADFTFDEVILMTGDELAARTEDGTRVLVLGLIAFALAAGLASLVACGQALQRRLAVPIADHTSLRALGFTRSQQLQAAILPVVPVAVGGALLAGGLSVPLSTFLPIGRARLAEPDPGMAVDWLVLGLGLVAILAITLLLGVIGGWRVIRRASDLSSSVVPSGTTRAARVARSSSTPAVQVGVTMALEPGRGSTAVPVRSAIGGAVAGIAGVVAALTFASSLDALVDTPARYGWNWSFAPDVFDEDLPTLLAIPGVEDVGVIDQRQVVVEGEQAVAMAMATTAGHPELTMLQGRMPATDDEIVLGPKRADHLGVSVGDTIDVQQGDGTRSMFVVGEALFPTFDDSAFNDAVAVTGDAIVDIATSDGDENGRVVVRFASGISAAEGERRMTDALPGSLSIYAFATPPGDVVNLSQVRSLPRALAGFLVLLALAAVGHALATSVRRRRRDLGVLRSIGFVGRDVLTSIGMQSITLLAVGLAVGIPLGVVVGRVVWSLVAGGLGVAVAPAVPIGLLIALVPGAVAAGLVLAAWPARAATRVRAAEALRAE